MPNTVHGLPYPASTAPPNVPADIRALAEAVDTYGAPVIGSYQRTTNQTIPTATFTNIIGTAVGTVEGGLTLNGSTGEVTIPATGAGLYLLNGWIAYVSNATGSRYAYLARNGTRMIRAGQPGHASIGTTVTVALTLRLAAGDKITLVAYQASGAGLDVDGTNNATGFNVTRLGG